MKRSPYTWVYITLLGFVFLFLAWLLFSINADVIKLSLPLYFFLLLIGALSATAFLTGAMRSSARWEGTFMKGKLALTGPVVVFFVIIILGYRFRPEPSNEPFDLTVYLFKPAGSRNKHFENGQLFILDGKEKKAARIDSNGGAYFTNVNPAYLGSRISLSADIDNYRIAQGQDTTIAVPDVRYPVIKLPLIAKPDSLLIRGTVYKTGVKKTTVLRNTLVQFSAFGTTTTTDDNGYFTIRLPLKPGDMTDVTVLVAGDVKYASRLNVANAVNITVKM